jgi:hypothetical protein
MESFKELMISWVSRVFLWSLEWGALENKEATTNEEVKTLTELWSQLIWPKNKLTYTVLLMFHTYCLHM